MSNYSTGMIRCPKCGHRMPDPHQSAAARSTSPAKAAAARANGRLGGRPRKTPPPPAPTRRGSANSTANGTPKKRGTRGTFQEGNRLRPRPSADS